jgi:uncharacterized protein YbjT (DUF2867 family)
MKILIIGAQGMLGRPVTRRLLQDGFSIRVLARKPEVAAKSLPGQIEIVPGDLQDIASLTKAVAGCEAVYLSVDSGSATHFHPERDGLSNLVKAIKAVGEMRLFVLSALGTSAPEISEHPWWHVREKFAAQQIAKNSGLSWTILEPTWFMESLPLFVRNGVFTEFSPLDLKCYWVAGDDMGRMISVALEDGIGKNETIAVQGPEKLSLHEAAQRFVQAYDPAIKIKRAPVWILKLLSPFHKQIREFSSLLKYYGNKEDPSPKTEIREKFGQPEMTIERYAEYVLKTGDFPQKS